MPFGEQTRYGDQELRNSSGPTITIGPYGHSFVNIRSFYTGTEQLETLFVNQGRW